MELFGEIPEAEISQSSCLAMFSNDPHRSSSEASNETNSVSGDIVEKNCADVLTSSEKKNNSDVITSFDRGLLRSSNLINHILWDQSRQIDFCNGSDVCDANGHDNTNYHIGYVNPSDGAKKSQLDKLPYFMSGRQPDLASRSHLQRNDLSHLRMEKFLKDQQMSVHSDICANNVLSKNMEINDLNSSAESDGNRIIACSSPLPDNFGEESPLNFSESPIDASEANCYSEVNTHASYIFQHPNSRDSESSTMNRRTFKSIGNEFSEIPCLETPFLNFNLGVKEKNSPTNSHNESFEKIESSTNPIPLASSEVLDSVCDLRNKKENVEMLLGPQENLSVRTPRKEITEGKVSAVDFYSKKDSAKVVSTKVHWLYRVFLGGGFALTLDEVVVDCELMNLFLHKSVRHVLYDSSIQMASRLQAFMWPIVAQGRSLLAIGERSAGKTLGYVLPLLSLLLDMWPCVQQEAGLHLGAVAIIVCKGWHAVQSVGFTCEELLSDTNLKVLAAWGGFGNAHDIEVEKAVCRGADVFVTTLPFLLRLINVDDCEKKVNFDVLSRCFHLVIDDADVIMENYPSGVKRLLTEWVASRVRSNFGHFSQQLVMTASTWTDYVDSLNRFLSPLLEQSVVISSPLEAACAASVSSEVHVCASSQNDEVLQLAAKIVKDRFSKMKTMIFVKNSRDNKKLAKLFHGFALYSQKINGRMLAWQIQNEVNEWNSSSDGRILIVSARTVSHLLEQKLDAVDVILHLHIPQQKVEFDQRLSFMMRNMEAASADSACAPGVSLVLCSKSDVLPKYLEKSLRRLNSSVASDWLPVFDERENSQVPVCHYLKAFGCCSEVHLCTWRHAVVPEDKLLLLPTSGVVTVDIVKVVNASRFLVRLTEYRETTASTPMDLAQNYLSLFMDVQNFATDSENLYPMTEVSVGATCLLNHNSIWCRGRVLQAGHKMALVFLLDEGDEISVSCSDLFQLPAQLAQIPQLIIEVYLCNIRPLDFDKNWTNSANMFVEAIVNHACSGTQFSGTIAMSLASTLWLSPLVEILKVEGVSARGESFRSRLIRAGFGCENERHISTLQKSILRVPPPECSKRWLDFWSE